MRAYKVVARLANNWLVSCVVTSPSVRVHYEIGKAAKPKVKGSCLCAFRSLKEAQRFSQDESFANPCEIYEAEVTVSPMKRVPARAYNRTFDNVQRLWQEKRYFPVNASNWPLSTVFCKEITLIKKVE